MRVAVFYSGYLPGEKYGGPVSSIYNLTELLGDDVEFFIICTNHDLNEKTPYDNIRKGWNRVGKAKVIYLSDSEYGKNAFFKILNHINPDLIYASSLFSAKQTYPLLSISKKKNLPLLLAPRGELNDNALSIKSQKKRAYLLLLKLFRKFSATYFQATSEEEFKNIIHYLGIKKQKVIILPNVPSLPVHKDKIEKKAGFLKLCFVGRIVENKNLLIAIKAVIAAKSNVEFDIFGPVENKEYWKQCMGLIKSAPPNVKITYKGALSPEKMRMTYSYYDCLISPTRFENYGQSIVEAMLHDVPVIISKGTTPWDDISDSHVGYIVPLNDVAEYTNCIENIAQMTESQYKELVVKLRDFTSLKFNPNALKNAYAMTFRKIR